MKILVVPSWYPTEDNPINGIFFKEQVKALQKHGFEVSVLYPEIRTIHKVKQAFKERGMIVSTEDGIKTYRYIAYNLIPGRVPFSTARMYYAKLKKLYREFLRREGKPDVIHAHACLWGGWAAAQLAKEERIPFIITEHSSAFLRGLLADYEKKEISKTLEAATEIIAVGPSLKQELEKYTNKHIHQIENIVNIDDFVPLKTSDQQGKNKRFRFLSVAFLNKNKRMDLLIRAFTQAFRNQEVELVIGGQGNERIPLEHLVSELQMQEQITFLGNLDRQRVVEELQKADVFTLASQFETFGVVFIEALACGKPIIATRSGGPEAIVNEINGIIVPVDDIHALADAMKTLKENYHQYNQDAIRLDCLARFSENAIIEKISKLYELSTTNE